VYGPRDYGFLPLFRLAARGVFPMVARPDAAFSLIHIDDLARAIFLAATLAQAVGETMFLAHERPHTTDGVLRGLADASGRRYRPLRVPRPALYAAAGAGELAWLFHRQPVIDRARLRDLVADGFVCSVERARQVLGFRADIDWPEGVSQTARWYREHRWV
jgi:nucleoside-diphosphate-sugar epimerase